MIPRATDWMQAYRGRRVLVTGHTGFKGGWLSLWLHRLGASVTGYSLAPPADRDTVFAAARVEQVVTHVVADIRDETALWQTWQAAAPEVVFHLAAQPLVLEGYRDPATTVATNVLGTVNVLEAARRAGAPVALVLVTSDKCYDNLEIERGYHEDDRLGGADVYSGSKAAAELLISSYRRSFFEEAGAVAVASVRAGNVIGGGDWSQDRLVPDAVRALRAGRPIDVRHPDAVRPWQHVLEPLSGYLQLGARLLERRNPALCTAWNFGPSLHNARTVSEVVERIVRTWGSGTWRSVSPAGEPHEATLLRLDIERAQAQLRWTPRWDFERAVDETMRWYREYAEGRDMSGACLTQIAEYEKTPAGVVTAPA